MYSVIIDGNVFICGTFDEALELATIVGGEIC